MTLDPKYLEYPKRGHGMDHDWYAWTMQPDRPKVAWPDGNRLAFFCVMALEFFPLNPPAEPFKAPGGMSTPYPDLRHYTLRDYGNRVGVFRVMAALEAAGITPTVAINSKVAERYPWLLKQIAERGWEVIGYGVDMGRLHHGDLDEAAERAQIQEALGVLRSAGLTVTGWASPAKSQSMSTLDLLAAEGIGYVTDWMSDEMPFPLTTKNGPLWSLPLQHEMDDQTLMLQYQHTEEQFCEQVSDQADVLSREATANDGRMMTLMIHPWMSGQPHRIGALERALGHVMSIQGVWSASGAQILAAAKP
jgi:peptidoglycan/xylan/chitin deacetylase (PgdA/CDA1 family)